MTAGHAGSVSSASRSPGVAAGLGVDLLKGLAGRAGLALGHVAVGPLNR